MCTVQWLLEDGLDTYWSLVGEGKCSTADAWAEHETESAAVTDSGITRFRHDYRCCLSESLSQLSLSDVVSVSLAPVSSFVCFGLN